MKAKASELTDAALDWAVAFATEVQFREGRRLRTVRDMRSTDSPCWIECENAPSSDYFHRFSPSTDWTRGGPIIERELITARPVYRAERTEGGDDIYRHDGWTAFVEPKAFWVTPRPFAGPTPLIAAMRCYVASKLGEEVDIPDELIQPTP